METYGLQLIPVAWGKISSSWKYIEKYSCGCERWGRPVEWRSGKWAWDGQAAQCSGGISQFHRGTAHAGTVICLLERQFLLFSFCLFFCLFLCLSFHLVVFLLFWCSFFPPYFPSPSLFLPFSPLPPFFPSLVHNQSITILDMKIIALVQIEYKQV